MPRTTRPLSTPRMALVWWRSSQRRTRRYAGAVTWSWLTGGDAEDFEIDKANGVLTFADSPDYEMPGDATDNNEYTVTVVATDADSITK